MDLRSLNKVWEVKPLKRYGEEVARTILEDVAKQVQPIMKKRRWTVRILSEFCPSNPSLLGLNIGGGSEVKLRLRRPKNESVFFPYVHILDTMLHELCHIEHGPHDSSFYALLAEIRQECEELMVKGAAGAGRRVGGGRAEFSSVRENTVNAAVKRARTGAILPSGPLRVGGDADIMSVLSPVQAAAMAAERRLTDDMWCGSPFSEMKSEPLIDVVGPTYSGSGSGYGSVSGSGSAVSAADGPWECVKCTLMNQEIGLVCEACGEKKSRRNIWRCVLCTLDNSTRVDRCIACDQWRYSHGPPSAFPPPHLST